MPSTNGKIEVAEAFRHLQVHHDFNDNIQVGSFHRIGMKGKVWKLISGGETYTFIRSDDGTPLPTLDVVIVGINKGISRLYYAGQYTEDSNNPPTCASVAGIEPDPGVPIPQSKTCGGCPHSQWKPNRGGKDCQEHKRVAVLLLPYMKTKPILPAPLIEPVFLKIPPASLKKWKAYTDDLQARNAPFPAVITRITFEPDKQFEMRFDMLKTLKNDDAKLVLPLLEDAKTSNILGSMAEYKAIAAPKMDVPEDTGLAAAFGQAAPREETSVTSVVPAKRGPKPKPKKEEPVEAKSDEGEEASWEEPQDESLDSMMTEVLNKAGKAMS